MTTTFNEQEQSMDALRKEVALQLADYMENDPRWHDASTWEKEAAAELRRLHSENLEQRITIENLKSKIDWLRDQRKILTKYGEQQ